MIDDLKSYFISLSHYVFLAIAVNCALFLIFTINSIDPVRDDAYSYLLPNIVLQGETLFESHQLPFINYYQLLGSPLLPQGHTGVLYPFHYLFYLIVSFSGFSDLTLILILEYFFHVSLGAVFIYKFLTIESFGKTYSFFGALMYSLSGCVIVLAGNWPILLPYVAFFPAIVLFIRVQKWRLLLLSMLLLFLAGHPQFFLMHIAFAYIYFFYYFRDKKSIVLLIKVSVMLFLLVLPILFPLFRGFISSLRFAGESEGGLWLSVQPISLITTLIQAVPIFKQMTGFVPVFIVMYFPGLSLAMVLTIYSVLKGKLKVEGKMLAGLLWRSWYPIIALIVCSYIYFVYVVEKTINDPIVSINVVVGSSALVVLYWLALKAIRSRTYSFIHGSLFILANLLLFGLYSIVAIPTVPFYAFFRWPIKWALLVTFFLTTALIHFLKQLELKPAVITALSVVVILLSVYSYGVHWRHINFNHYYSRYNTVTTAMVEAFDTSKRIVAVGNSRESVELIFAGKTYDISPEQYGHKTKLLTANFPTHYRIFALSGYDPLVAREKRQYIPIYEWQALDEENDFTEENLRMYRVYGVGQYIHYNKSAKSPEFFLENKFEQIYSDDDVTVYVDNLADKIVTSDSTNESIRFDVVGNNINIFPHNVNLPQNITVRFFYDLRNWRAVDASSGQSLSITPDAYGRIVVHVPSGVAQLTLKYVDQDFVNGVWVSGLGLSVWLSALVIRRGLAIFKRQS